LEALAPARKKRGHVLLVSHSQVGGFRGHGGNTSKKQKFFLRFVVRSHKSDNLKSQLQKSERTVSQAPHPPRPKGRQPLMAACDFFKADTMLGIARRFEKSTYHS